MCIYYVKDLVITSLLFLCFLRAQTARPNLPVLFRPQEKQLLQGESHLSQTCTWDAQKWFKTKFPCVDTSFRTSNTNLPASCCYPLAEQGIYPQAKIISKAQVGGPARRLKSNLGGCEVVRQRDSPLPPLPHSHGRVCHSSSIQRQFAFHVVMKNNVYQTKELLAYYCAVFD